eukprot:5554595-Lingulodinium_polyedra.AAC.1
MAGWIAAWGGGALRGAEDLAWQLAVELEAAEAAGRFIAGAALDWRKAFDHVPLTAVSAGLERAGVPEWLRGPVCSAYAAPRRIRVDTERSAASGSPPAGSCQGARSRCSF